MDGAIQAVERALALARARNDDFMASPVPAAASGIPGPDLPLTSSEDLEDHPATHGPPYRPDTPMPVAPECVS